MNKIKYLLFLVMINCLPGPRGFGQSTSQYDEDISQYVAKIMQYPGRSKYLEKLKETYDQANTADQETIKALRLTGQPDIWYGIFQSYRRMENRQKMVMTLPDKTVQQSGITIMDYQPGLNESRHKAQDYYIAHGQKLLASDKPGDAVLAYEDFMKVAGLNNYYPGLDKMIRKSILKGATNMEFEMYNRTHKIISASMVDQLGLIIWDFKKARYGQAQPEKTDDSFAIVLRVILKDLQISPDQAKDLEYQEERDIFQDGLVVDTISCMVQETRQRKTAQLTGTLEYVDKRTGQVVNRIDIKVESVFSNAYANLQGNPDAAGDSTRELLKSRKAAYPSDEQMILDATEEFAKKAGEVMLAE